MIIVQAPLRVSFFGGGTDFQSYFMQNGGAVLSTAIDKFVYVTIKRRFDQKLRVGWTSTDFVDSIDELRHDLIRESFRLLNLQSGVEISTMADIPTQGSGLGSSSTVTVGALHAMHTYLNQLVSRQQLAKEACQIEIDILGNPIGIQDQYICAYGGLKFFEFLPNGEVHSEAITLSTNTMRKLNANTMLFFTGVTRKAASILTTQKTNIPKRTVVLAEMKGLAYSARDELLKGNVDALGELLHESWELKKQLASQISNPEIDTLYTIARKAGAIGGKITGAGGGGFLLLYCPLSRQDDLRNALCNLQELPFQIDADGSKVIFDHRR